MTGMRWRLLALGALLLAAFAPATARPADQRAGGPTPPRLSFIDGEVSFWRPGAEDWAPAEVNTPLADGDSLYAGDGGNLEVQIGPRTFVRAGSGTELGLESLEAGLVQFKVTAGHAAVDARQIPRGRAIEIDTPNAAFTIDRPGYYRVDVDQEHTTFVTRQGGQASVVPANGESTDVAPDQQVVLEGTETPRLETAAAPEPDDWDRWNLDRTGRLPESSASARYVPPDVPGTEDLDRYGSWRDVPRYGHVWAPADPPPGWAPYSAGHWIWDPYYGWTWVDDAPWGWAPYHYGRWVFVDGVWAWAPGPVAVAPVYAPALVAFLGPSVSVSVGVPFPFVGWVALGFGEPCIPWWGPVGFVGTAWWGGWGGPRVVNNVVIERNTFVNVRNITVYRNVNVHNAVIGVRRDQFGRGPVEHAHLARADLRNLRPIHGQVPVRPTPASLVPRPGHGLRPPEQVHARPVVATRAPHDPATRLHAAGLAPSPQHGAAPAPRLVPSPRQHAGGPARSLGGTREAPGRMNPPPPPRRPGLAAAPGRPNAPAAGRPNAPAPGRANAPTPPRTRAPHAGAGSEANPRTPRSNRAPAPPSEGGHHPRAGRAAPEPVPPHAEPRAPRGYPGAQPGVGRERPSPRRPAPAPAPRERPHGPGQPSAPSARSTQPGGGLTPTFATATPRPRREHPGRMQSDVPRP